MKIKFDDFATIISGYTFRGAIDNQSTGNAFALQAKNIAGGEAIINCDNLARISFNGARGAFFLQNDDVVVVSRGSGKGAFRAAVFKNHDSNIMAASSVFIIRILDDKVSPDYVCAFINSREGQKCLMETVTGSSIKTILRGKLKETKIWVPPIEKQAITIKLIDNLKRQKAIYQQSIQIKQNIANSIFENI